MTKGFNKGRKVLCYQTREISNIHTTNPKYEYTLYTEGVWESTVVVYWVGYTSSYSVQRVVPLNFQSVVELRSSTLSGSTERELG